MNKINYKELHKEWKDEFNNLKNVNKEDVARFLEQADLGDLIFYDLQDGKGNYWYEWRLVIDSLPCIKIAFALDYKFLLDVYSFESLLEELKNVEEEAETTEKEILRLK